MPTKLEAGPLISVDRCKIHSWKYEKNNNKVTTCGPLGLRYPAWLLPGILRDLKWEKRNGANPSSVTRTDRTLDRRGEVQKERSRAAAEHRRYKEFWRSCRGVWSPGPGSSAPGVRRQQGNGCCARGFRLTEGTGERRPQGNRRQEDKAFVRTWSPLLTKLRKLNFTQKT